MCDRNKTQILALQEIWPNLIIIYCGIHIGRNIRTKVNKDIYNLYEQMILAIISEKNLLKNVKILSIKISNKIIK